MDPDPHPSLRIRIRNTAVCILYIHTCIVYLWVVGWSSAVQIGPSGEDFEAKRIVKKNMLRNFVKNRIHNLIGISQGQDTGSYITGIFFQEAIPPADLRQGVCQRAHQQSYPAKAGASSGTSWFISVLRFLAGSGFSEYLSETLDGFFLSQAIQDRVLKMIQSWAHAFSPDPDLQVRWGSECVAQRFF